MHLLFKTDLRCLRALGEIIQASDACNTDIFVDSYDNVGSGDHSSHRHKEWPHLRNGLELLWKPRKVFLCITMHSTIIILDAKIKCHKTVNITWKCARSAGRKRRFQCKWVAAMNLGMRSRQNRNDGIILSAFDEEGQI